MKKLIISTIITTGIILAGNAQAGFIDPVKEQKLVKVCEAIKSDSLISLHVAVKDSGVGLTQLANGLKCNGSDPVSFAMQYDAASTAKFMAKKSRKNHQELLAKL